MHLVHMLPAINWQDWARDESSIVSGKKLSKTPDITKVSVATQMFELIHDEDREIISKAFMEGANLTEKGSMTYFYNCKRKFKEKS
jgi:hypothetical protein